MLAKTLVMATGIISLIMTSCMAHADPPTFPDFSSYTPVNAQDYTIGLPNTGRAPLNTVYFLTPDGITCDFFRGGAMHGQQLSRSPTGHRSWQRQFDRDYLHARANQ
jgi:hypothetical protein